MRTLLEADPNMDVITESANLNDIQGIPPETVLVISAGGALQPDFGTLLQDEESPAAVVFITYQSETVQLFSGLPLRAWGILPLDVSQEELVIAVRAVSKGLIITPPAFLHSFLKLPETRNYQEPESIEQLTPREGEVLQLLAQGYPNKQIALELNISEHTVKIHISSIYAKLGATNRTEAVRLGFRRGLIVL